MAVNIGCHKHTGCYKAFMKHEGILTDWRFFPTMKRESVNISAGVFSLSKTSCSKVSFPNFLFCTTGRFWTSFWVRERKIKCLIFLWNLKLDGPSRYGTFNNAHVYSFHHSPNCLGFLNHLFCRPYAWIICAAVSFEIHYSHYMRCLHGEIKAFVVCPARRCGWAASSRPWSDQVVEFC